MERDDGKRLGTDFGTEVNVGKYVIAHNLSVTGK